MNPTRRTITADAQRIIAHIERLQADLAASAPELDDERRGLSRACAAVDDVVTALAHRPAAVARTRWSQRIRQAINSH